MASYLELMSQIETLQKQAQDALHEEKSSALHKITQTMEAYGLTVEDITNRIKGSRKPRNVKNPGAVYKDPETGKTWGGLGKPPLWIAGKDREQFRVA